MQETISISGGTESELIRQLAHLIVEAVNLEVDPTAVNPDQPIFGDGLGLDSIDALEIALAISQRYGFQLRSDDDNNAKIFSSLRSLAEHVKINRSR